MSNSEVKDFMEEVLDVLKGLDVEVHDRTKSAMEVFYSGSEGGCFGLPISAKNAKDGPLIIQAVNQVTARRNNAD